MGDYNDEPCDCCCGDLMLAGITWWIVDLTTEESLRLDLGCPYGDPIEFDVADIPLLVWLQITVE